MDHFKDMSYMLLFSTVVVRGIDRTDVVIPVVYFSNQVRARRAAPARPGRAFLTVSWPGSLALCDGRHGRQAAFRDCGQSSSGFLGSLSALGRKAKRRK